MASFVASSSVVATPSAFASSSPSAVSYAAESPSALSFSGLRANTFAGKEASLSSKTVSNGSRVSCMLVWPPYDNKRYETLSYLPALTPEQIAKQVDYITGRGWIPCLEFDKIGSVYREHFHGSGYYDGRYWVMWKLPMFGCTDSGAVLREIGECKKAYPEAFIRVLGFDAKRQVQVCGFLVHKPT